MPEDRDEFDSLSSAAVPGIDGAPPNGQGSADAGALQRRLDETTSKLNEQRDLYLRTLADFDNFKRRTERDTASRADAARRKLLLRVLDVLDNFDRAATYRQSGTPPEQLVDGVLATVKQISSLLEAEGVTPIEVAGKTFDPKLAEAVGTRSQPGKPANVVLDEARKGYRIGDELLRPAQVIVSSSE
ncbi:MAG TPA: nucleotide exchange factor GrpE [Candidatus Acidoferrales bacterium]|nr:nucleotide exchange factor GrpE [Candidatus Acidoferrales bacterium]